MAVSYSRSGYSSVDRIKALRLFRPTSCCASPRCCTEASFVASSCRPGSLWPCVRSRPRWRRRPGRFPVGQDVRRWRRFGNVRRAPRRGGRAMLAPQSSKWLAWWPMRSHRLLSPVSRAWPRTDMCVLRRRAKAEPEMRDRAGRVAQRKIFWLVIPERTLPNARCVPTFPGRTERRYSVCKRHDAPRRHTACNVRLRRRFHSASRRCFVPIDSHCLWSCQWKRASQVEQLPIGHPIPAAGRSAVRADAHWWPRAPANGAEPLWQPLKRRRPNVVRHVCKSLNLSVYAGACVCARAHAPPKPGKPRDPRASPIRALCELRVSRALSQRCSTPLANVMAMRQTPAGATACPASAEPRSFGRVRTPRSPNTFALPRTGASSRGTRLPFAHLGAIGHDECLSICSCWPWRKQRDRAPAT